MATYSFVALFAGDEKATGIQNLRALNDAMEENKQGLIYLHRYDPPLTEEQLEEVQNTPLDRLFQNAPRGRFAQFWGWLHREVFS